MSNLDSKIIPKTLHHLIERVSELPEEHQLALLPAMAELTEDVMKKLDILYQVRTMLGTLRTDIKYLMFDLEATRQERDEALGKL